MPLYNGEKKIIEPYLIHSSNIIELKLFFQNQKFYQNTAKKPTNLFVHDYVDCDHWMWDPSFLHSTATVDLEMVMILSLGFALM